MQTRRFDNPMQRDESQLIAAVMKRDDSAVREMLRRHNQRLYRLARGILRNDNDAEDALQVAYLRAFSQLASFRARPPSAPGWGASC